MLHQSELKLLVLIEASSDTVDLLQLDCPQNKQFVVFGHSPTPSVHASHRIDYDYTATTTTLSK
jgi:hypothetical protein